MPQALSDIRSNLNNLLQLNSTAGAYWSVSEQNQYINQALLMAAGDIRWKLQTFNFNLALYKMWYLAPTDLLVPIRILDIHDSKTDLKVFPADVTEFEKDWRGWRQVGSSQPTRIIFRSIDYMMIWPPPSSDYDGKPFQLVYVPVPPTLVNDTDVLDAPLDANKAVVKMAEALCLFKRDPALALKRYDEYKEKVALATADLDRNYQYMRRQLAPSDRFDKASHSTLFRRVYP